MELLIALKAPKAYLLPVPVTSLLPYGNSRIVELDAAGAFIRQIGNPWS